MTDLYSDLRDAQPPLAPPRSAMAIGAHPDDAEFGAGGTLSAWAGAGCRVTLLIVTDGSKGTWDPGADPADLAEARRSEARAAGSVIGAADVIFLDHVDGELEYSMDLRAEVCRQIRLVRPEIVLSHDPWQRYQLHPDHRATGLAAVDGVVAARDPLFFPDQGLTHHRPAALLLWSADEPDHWQDIAGSIDRKIAALLEHASQGATTMGGADSGGDRLAAFTTKITERAAAVGAPVGLTAAEAFRRITP